MMGRLAQRFATAIERPTLAYAASLCAVAAAATLRAIARQFLADLERAEAAFAAQRDAGQGDGPVDGPGADGDEGWDRLPDDPAAGDEDDSPRP